MARMPGTTWQGERSPRTRMSRYDIVCLHTIVGYAPAHAAHFSVRANGQIIQSRDTAYRSAANLNGNHRVIAIENEDHGSAFGSWNVNNGHAVPDFTAAQIESNAQILAWAHRVHGIPLQLAPNSRPGSRGLGYHRQGCDGNFGGYRFPGRVSGGELWSGARGKVCPGDKRIARRQQILDRARQIVGGGTTTPPPEDDMAYSDWPKKDRDKLVDDLRRAVVFDRTYDYVNDDESTLRHQVARAHQNSHNTSRSSWIDRIARAVALMTNGVSGRTLSAHIRRGDLSESRLTSRVSGNKISAATSLLNAQEKATHARNEGRTHHAETKAMLEAIADQLDALVPGVAAKVREVAAEVAREEAARVNAADVASELEVVVAAEDHDGEDHDAEVLAEKAVADAEADAATEPGDSEDAS